MSMDKDKLQYFIEHVQDYVDGTMPRREAVEFYLLARKEPRLKAELEATRLLLAELDRMPIEGPSRDFDAAILASLPLERYRTAPRLPKPILVLGELREAILERTIRRMRRPLLALSAAYALTLLVSHSFLARSAREFAGLVDRWLADAVARTAEIPVVSAVVSGMARLYDAVGGTVSAAFALLGDAAGTVLFGFLVAGAVWSAAALSRRRQSDSRLRI